jgi:hypothetical protein
MIGKSLPSFVQHPCPYNWIWFKTHTFRLESDALKPTTLSAVAETIYLKKSRSQNAASVAF